MSPQPVSRYRLTSSDPEEAIEHLRAAYTWVDTAPVAGGDFEFSLEGVACGAVELAMLRYSASIVGTCEPPERLVAAIGGSAARSRASHGREDARGTALLAPAVPYAMESQGATVTRTVALDRDVVARVGAELTGLEPGAVTFHGMAPRTPLLARYWSDLAAHVHRDLLAHRALLAEPLLRAQTVHQLATALLAVFPNTTHTLEPTATRRGGAAPAAVRRASEFIDANAHRAVTVTEIAAAAGVGARSLQDAFLRHRGVSPLAHLRRVRLHRAHADLVAADPTRGDTVAGIAARWGFAQPARFAAYYREQFGRLPSVTLRR